MSREQDEKTLLEAVAAGSREAFTCLYSTHLSGLFRYARLFVASPAEAEELIQEVFVRIWERRATLTHISSFKAYAYQTTKHLVIDCWREKKQQAIQQQRFLREAAAPSLADEELIYHQGYQLAQQAIAQLPPKRKQIFLLRTQDELSLDDIAQELAISKPVVKKQFYAATAFVKAYLKRHADWSFGAFCLLALVKLTVKSAQ
ncbi:sigma-70 family RNA polymerase sigma factor [Hymenobacter tibetensis]|uniref:Sigma-70 family RNA polymerase sigma factor n=1 Tax=Hymenobacter tibetensis TaxID=497967 RepID=A0ABY4CSS1_9BACT|nr:sigma-70 family RNA polymerase sigma factor [Hymenobacter tibetensis]UOG73300.1 sigma-70 family RNA polymerase sigma factor [Hymenobacter tibetensis]